MSLCLFTHILCPTNIIIPSFSRIVFFMFVLLIFSSKCCLLRIFTSNAKQSTCCELDGRQFNLIRISNAPLCIFPRNDNMTTQRKTNVRIPRGQLIVVGTNGDTSFINQCRGCRRYRRMPADWSEYFSSQFARRFEKNWRDYLNRGLYRASELAFLACSSA